MRSPSKFHTGEDPVSDSALAEEASIRCLVIFSYSYIAISLGNPIEAGAGEQFCRAQPTATLWSAARSHHGGQDRAGRGAPRLRSLYIY